MFDFLENLSPSSSFSSGGEAAPALAHETAHAAPAHHGRAGGAADLGYASHYADGGGHHRAPTPPRHPLTQAEMHEMMDEPAPQQRPTPPLHPLTQAEMHEMMDEPAAKKPASGRLTQQELVDLLE